MYGCETWATTMYLCAQLDAFDTWALREILGIPYTCYITVTLNTYCQGVPRFPAWQQNDA